MSDAKWESFKHWCTTKLNGFIKGIDEYILTNSIRWTIFTWFSLVTYASFFYLGANAWNEYIKKQGATSSFKTDTNLVSGPNARPQKAYLFVPWAGGYNVVRGDVTSPPLFKWTWQEILFWVAVVLLFPLIFFITYMFYTDGKDCLKNQPNPIIYVWIFIMQAFSVWLHVVMIMMIIPFNSFHKRFLYNVRCFFAEVVNNPLEELIMAFMFIVVIPWPGEYMMKQNFVARIKLMFFKIGLFYVLQNILIGDPQYTVEPPDTIASNSKYFSEIPGSNTLHTIYYWALIGLCGLGGLYLFYETIVHTYHYYKRECSITSDEPSSKPINDGTDENRNMNGGDSPDQQLQEVTQQSEQIDKKVENLMIMQAKKLKMHEPVVIIALSAAGFAGVIYFIVKTFQEKKHTPKINT